RAPVRRVASRPGLPESTNGVLTSLRRVRHTLRALMAPPLPEDDETPDSELVARWMGGEERAATLLVARHAQALSRYAASLGGRQDVDELVQDTFVRAFGSLDQFRGESSRRTWLFTILRRLLID